MTEVMQITIEQIKTGEHNVRAQIDDEDVNDLTSSIARIGIIQPLVVQQRDDGYLLIAGHRRMRAAQLANLKSVPCIISEYNDVDVKEISFAENFFRADLSPIEQAAAIKDVIDSGGLTVGQVAAGFHRSPHWVDRQVEILTWPDDVLAAIHDGWLSVAAAHNLALIEDEDYRVFLLRNAEEGGATARVTTSWLQAWRSMAPPEAALSAPPAVPGSVTTPAVPQAPCICCSQVQRTDALSSVLICGPCIGTLRNAGISG